MSTHAAEREEPFRYIRARRLAERLDISVATVWRWVSSGRLPQPVRLGPGVTAWRLTDIEEALRGREHAPG